LVPYGRLSWFLVSFWAHVNIVHHIISYHIIPIVKDVGVVVTVLTVLAVGVVSVVGAVELSVTHTRRAEYFQ